MASHHLAITLPRGLQKSEDASAAVSLSRPMRAWRPRLFEIDPLICGTDGAYHWRSILVQEGQGAPEYSSWHEQPVRRGFMRGYSTGCCIASLEGGRRHNRLVGSLQAAQFPQSAMCLASMMSRDVSRTVRQHFCRIGEMRVFSDQQRAMLETTNCGQEESAT